ncbi:MAG TPA: alkaline phosphatase family protein, partial [Bryobacteraceae bacterium]|nr:alkaline phosphatase family protein [Bryobacteraceae bacterium]
TIGPLLATQYGDMVAQIPAMRDQVERLIFANQIWDLGGVTLDLREFEKTGNMPQLILMRLGNDHTSGTEAGKPTPLAAMADNDAALGMVVEAVSKSRFWRDTAIFVLEDDAQNGPDHVDSHRSPAFVISPYVKRGKVDSTMYNTTSMLRTIELILGLRPMTHFDAAARPMASVFQNTPDLTPYTAEQPRINLDDRNSTSAPAAAGSARLDLEGADRMDGLELSRVLWLALRGPGSVAPAPSRSVFSR